MPWRTADEALKESNGLESLGPSDADGRVGVSKSINNPSLPLSFVGLSPAFLGVSSLCCDPRCGVRLRVSSKDGMFLTGDTGTVGLRIDLRGADAVD